MKVPAKAYRGCQIFDGTGRHNNCALLINGDRVFDIVAITDIPEDFEQIVLAEGLICPGFVDLQVNGGGGVMLNDSPTAEAMQTICETHLAFGTTSLLPTLITDSVEKTNCAIQTAIQVANNTASGVLGLHLEGPHLCSARKGTHEAKYIRAMEKPDLDKLIAAAASIPSLLLTVATEAVTDSQIAELKAAGAIICIGHSNASYADIKSAVVHGATGITHLFNAMSPLANREPGVVGAALQLGALSAGIIADGHHVDPTTISIAIRAKQGPGKIFLVTDSMSTIGTDLRELRLNNRLIKRENGRLTLEDGTLAGADLNMISAVKFIVERIGLTTDEALRMASLYPAQLLGRENEIGQLIAGTRADFLHLDQNLEINAVWLGGKQSIGNAV
jgi:N-acetylglucosamine-6-phosphate deacetylase